MGGRSTIIQVHKHSLYRECFLSPFLLRSHLPHGGRLLPLGYAQKKHLDKSNTIFYIKNMNVTISAHALQRMNERGISEEQVRGIFDTEDWTLIESKDGVAIVDFALDGKKWRFIFNKSTQTLITCYPRRK